MKTVKILMALFAIALLSVPLAWAQGGNPPASTKESGATSGHGMTAVEQTAKRDAEQQIKTLQEQGREAALKNDTSFQEKYLADNYVGIGADGRMFTKDEAIQRRKSGAVKYESITQEDSKIRIYGDTAVVNSLASLKGTSDGKPFSGDFRATFVYVKQADNWRQVSFQATPVAAESK